VDPHEPAIDLAVLMDRLGGDLDLLRELVGLYLADEGQLLEGIEAALGAGDADALRRSAHTLKGAVSNFCAAGAWSRAQALENAGRDGRLDEAPRLLEALRAELARVQEALTVLLPPRGD
jgi:HPt (histidine-containing phosphotransfer) domain-containing protein